MNSNSDFVAPLVRSLRKWIEEGRTEELGDWVLDAKTDLNTILPVPPTGIVPILKPGSPERDGVFATLSAASSPILSRVGQFISIAALRTQSPIEFYMLMGLVLCAFERSDNVLFAIDDSGTFGVKMLPASSEVIIEPQRQIGDYRVDFLVSWTETNWATANTRSEPPTQITTFLIVECDGHEYHERTKEQAKRDKGRDRILQSCGYSVFRFTGSEIYKDVIKCANSAIQFIEKKSKEQVYSK